MRHFLLLVLALSKLGLCDDCGTIAKASAPGLWWIEGKEQDGQNWSVALKQSGAGEASNRIQVSRPGVWVVADLSNRLITYIGDGLNMHGVSCRQEPALCAQAIPKIKSQLDHAKTAFVEGVDPQWQTKRLKVDIGKRALDIMLEEVQKAGH